jgi:excinuclease UvrABC nuclease subunit
LARSRNLRWRLARLLSTPRMSSRMLNLREIVARIDYQPVGSGFEAQWLLYLLNRDYYPALYRDRLRLKPPALLKINLSNRFPRCYPTRRLSNDGALYYGPFPSQVAAERVAAEFLDLFRIRRCVEDLEPHPSHPGCVYSQLRMCLAPCFAGCTDAEYEREIERVVEFLDEQGRTLLRSLEAERAQASEALEFEQAARIHRRFEKVNEILRQKPELVRNLRDLHAVVVQRGAEAKSVVFFRVCAGALRGPAPLSFDENVPSPVPLDEQLHHLLDSLTVQARGAVHTSTPPELRAGHNPLLEKLGPVEFARYPLGRDARSKTLRARGHASKGTRDLPPPPPWEHLSLLARWYYSSFREGELVMLNPDQSIPHARLIRTCRKLLAREV